MQALICERHNILHMFTVLELQMIAKLAIHPQRSYPKERLRVSQLWQYEGCHHGLYRGAQLFIALNLLEQVSNTV